MQSIRKYIKYKQLRVAAIFDPFWIQLYRLFISFVWVYYMPLRSYRFYKGVSASAMFWLFSFLANYLLLIRGKNTGKYRVNNIMP